MSGLKNLLLHSLDLFRLPLALLVYVPVMSLFYPSWPHWAHSVRSSSGHWWRGSFHGFTDGFVGPFVNFLPPSPFLLLALIPWASVQCAALGLFVRLGFSWVLVSFVGGVKFLADSGDAVMRSLPIHTLCQWLRPCAWHSHLVRFSSGRVFSVVWGGSYEAARCKLPRVRLYVVNRTEDEL